MITNNLNTTVTISNPNDRENYSRYLNDIGRLKPLSREEEIETFKLIEAGDQKAIEKICKHNLLFVLSVAKRYSIYLRKSSSLTLEDLISEGNMGMYMAINRFDYRTGNKFISYAVWWIRQSILTCIQRNIKSIRLPANVSIMVNKITKKENMLEQQLGRTPTTLEIFESMLEDGDMTEKDSCLKIDDFKLANSFETSLDSFIGGPSGDETTQFNQMIKSNDDEPDEQFILKEREQLALDMLGKIPEFMQKYFIDYFGIGGVQPLNFRQMGEKYDEVPSTIKLRIDRWLRRIRIENREKQVFFFPKCDYGIRRSVKDWNKDTIYLI